VVGERVAAAAAHPKLRVELLERARTLAARLTPETAEDLGHVLIANAKARGLDQ
jgi:hypothetical protein